MIYEKQMREYGYIPANHAAPVFFPVSIGDIYDKESRVIPGHKRIQRDDTGDTLAVHSDSYALIDYETSFRQFDEAIQNSGLDTTDMQICTDLSHNGARCFRQYLFPKHIVEIKEMDPVALRIVSFNSYDGSHALSLQAGAYRFVCANTSIIGRDVINLRLKHTGNAQGRVAEGIVKVADAAARFTAYQERMKLWSKTNLGIADFRDIVAKIPQATDRLTDNLVSRFAVIEDRTLWSGYNVLTSWSGERGASGRNAASGRHDREKRVAALVEGVHWTEVERKAA